MKTKLQSLIIAVMFAFGFGTSALAFPVVNLTGSGVSTWTPQGSLALSTTDGIMYYANNFQIKADGNIKFAFGTANWGDIVGFIAPSDALGFPNGQAAPGAPGTGGANIVGTLGYWNVSFNYTTRLYSFTVGVDPNAAIVLNGAGPDLALQTSNGIIYSKQSSVLSAGNAKFLEMPSPINPTPTAQWSSASFPSGSGTQTGSLIPVTSGIFNVAFEKSTGAYQFNDVPVSIVGNQKGGGWGWSTTAVDELTTFDNVNYELMGWSAMVTAPNAVAAGATLVEFKLIDNHDWPFQFGNRDAVTGLTPLTGFLLPKITADPPNCKLPQGVYNVAFNRLTLAYTFTVVTLATDRQNYSSFTVYPNPTSNNWNFVSKANNVIKSVQIVDVLGKVVMTNSSLSNELDIDASALKSGVYFARIATENATETVKLVKN
jgi:starch-binding outer membrane protein SusE/F